MGGARVVVTVARRNNSCHTFIVVCAVHEVAACGMFVKCLTFFFCLEHHQNC